jgi:hypothetical protein
MPVNPDGSLRAFTAGEISAMNIRTFDVRNGAHPTFTREVDQNTMTRKFLVAWAQKRNFVEHVCGWSRTYDDAGTTRLSRLLPNAVYGRDPGADAYEEMLATKIHGVRGHGAGTDDAVGMPEYTDAEIEVFYEAPNYAVLLDGAIVSERDRYVSFRPGPSEPKDVGPFPGGAFKYTTLAGVAPHGVPIPYGVSVQRVVTKFVLTFHDVPYSMVSNGGALWNRLQFGRKVAGIPDGISFISTVNSQDLEVASVGRTWAAGKLLLEKVETFLERRQTWKLSPHCWRYRVEFHYAYTPRGWLNLLLWDAANPARSDWYPVSADGVFYTPATILDGRGIFNARDHRDLFDPNY